MCPCTTMEYVHNMIWVLHMRQTRCLWAASHKDSSYRPWRSRGDSLSALQIAPVQHSGYQVTAPCVHVLLVSVWMDLDQLLVTCHLTPEEAIAFFSMMPSMTLIAFGGIMESETTPSELPAPAARKRLVCHASKLSAPRCSLLVELMWQLRPPWSWPWRLAAATAPAPPSGMAQVYAQMFELRALHLDFFCDCHDEAVTTGAAGSISLIEDRHLWWVKPWSPMKTLRSMWEGRHGAWCVLSVFLIRRLSLLSHSPDHSASLVTLELKCKMPFVSSVVKGWPFAPARSFLRVSFHDGRFSWLKTGL